MDTCPKCGGRIEATVPVYLENVVLDADGVIVGYELGFTWDEEHGGAFDWETGKARLYCENDHDIDYTTVDITKLPKLQLVAKS